MHCGWRSAGVAVSGLMVKQRLCVSCVHHGAVGDFGEDGGCVAAVVLEVVLM